MELYVDSANLKEIETAASWGVISGVTTNPSLVAREGGNFEDLVSSITSLIKGPVSAEVISLEADGMVAEARRLAKIANNVVIKVPMGEEGMKAVSTLSKEGIHCNVTLVFSLNQALLSARAGAAYVSPFVGRIDDSGWDGMDLVRQIAEVYGYYGFNTQIIAASIRHPLHVSQAALAGAHIATVPFKVLKQMFKHPLTDLGIERFLQDWQSTKR